MNADGWSYLLKRDKVGLYLRTLNILISTVRRTIENIAAGVMRTHRKGRKGRRGRKDNFNNFVNGGVKSPPIKKPIRKGNGLKNGSSSIC